MSLYVKIFLYQINPHIPPLLEIWPLTFLNLNLNSSFPPPKCVLNFQTTNNLTALSQIKSVKIIKDKDDKPKGFGYVEFEELEGLKYALTKTGSVGSPFLNYPI